MHYHHHSRGRSRPGLIVTTALFGQSSSATMFKSFREQFHPKTVRNKQDILEKFRRVLSVSSPDERAVQSTAKLPAVAILLQESIIPAIFRHLKEHIMQNQGQELRQTLLGEFERCSFPSPSVKLSLQTPITFRAKLIWWCNNDNVQWDYFSWAPGYGQQAWAPELVAVLLCTV